MDDVKQEFWGDLQVDLYVANTAIYLANQSLSELISTTGYKAHRPILSHPQVGTYTAHSDISFEEKDASKETLTVDTFQYAAEDIDITESKQTPYDLKKIIGSLYSNVVDKFLKLRETLIESIRSQTKILLGGSETIIGPRFTIG